MANTKGTSKWAHLLEDEDLERWYRVTARGSRLTAEVSLRRIGKACGLLGLDPKGMVKTAQVDLMVFADKVDDVVTRLEEEGLSPGYIEDIVQSIKSWLKYNGVELTRRIVISNRGRTPTIEDEQIPSKEELSRIFRISPPRVRVAEAFIALSDLRPQVLGDHWGQDGLRVRDLPELRIEDGKVTFEVVPTMVKVRENLSKARHAYFSFLPEEGCTYLAEYLESRIREGEVLSPESPVIGHKTKRKAVNPFIRTVKLGDLIRKSMRKAGVLKRPYVLRCYAETQLIIAESKGKISHPYLQFVAGHKGDIEAKYSTNKGRLPPDMIEDMREAYRMSQRYLQTTGRDAIEERLNESFRKQLLLVAGFSPEEVEQLDPSIDDEAFHEMVRRRLLGAMVNNGASQKVVDVNEVERFLSGGWDFVATLPNERVVIKLPR